MGVHGESDEVLLAARDAASFERFYRRHVDELLGFLVRRTRDAGLAADLTAETFAAALAARRGPRPEPGAAGTGLYGIALEQLADARRRGSVERRAQRRLGMERIALTDRDRARIGALREDRPPTLWAGRLAPDQREAVVAHVVDERREDFTTRLRLELRAAAERGERRGRLAPAATRVRPRPRPGALVAGTTAALAVALVAVLLAAAPAGPGAGPATPGTGLRVVANVALADGLGRSSQVAFGSVWANATNDGEVLRIDPRTRRVVARIPVGTDVNLGVGAGAVWAMPRRPGVTTTPLLRIDPRTNRVVARIPVNSPGARFPFGGASIVGAARVWVVSAMGLVAVDPARNRPVRETVLGGDFQVDDALVRGNELWISRADRSLTRFDVVTGRRLGRVPWTGPDGFVVPAGDRTVKVGRRTVSLVDAHGRPLWRTRLGTQLNEAGLAGGRLLVEGVNGSGARDTLWALDPRTGRVLDARSVPGFSVNALLTVGREAWLMTADGHAIVVAP